MSIASKLFESLGLSGIVPGLLGCARRRQPGPQHRADPVQLPLDQSATIYEHSLKLCEGLEEDLGYPILFSQHGVLNAVGFPVGPPKPLLDLDPDTAATISSLAAALPQLS